MIERSSDDHAIGVGMGGACPECRAPVELGQEFCLECGAALRTRGQRQRTTTRTTTSTSAPVSAASALTPPAGKKGFPWVPFLVVLALTVLAVVFALLGGRGGADSAKKGGEATTSSGGIPTLTNATTSSTPTSTVDSCPTGASDAATGDSATPGAEDPAAAADGSGVTTFGSADAAGAAGSSTPAADGSIVPTTSSVPTTDSPPATTPGGPGGAETVTVDQQGNLCPAPDASATTPTLADPSDTTPTEPATPGGPTTPTVPTTDAGDGTDTTPADDGSVASQDWPQGKSGYTVVLASFSQSHYSERDAQTRATQAQSRGVSSGVIDSDDFSSLTSGLWVVFSGIYDTEAQATAHQAEVRGKGYQGAYTRQVKP